MELKKLSFMKSKKGVLGLNTVKEVMIAFLVLGVIAVAIILALVSLRDSNIFVTGASVCHIRPLMPFVQ